MSVTCVNPVTLPASMVRVLARCRRFSGARLVRGLLALLSVLADMLSSRVLAVGVCGRRVSPEGHKNVTVR